MALSSNTRKNSNSKTTEITTEKKTLDQNLKKNWNNFSSVKMRLKDCPTHCLIYIPVEKLLFFVFLQFVSEVI